MLDHCRLFSAVPILCPPFLIAKMKDYIYNELFELESFNKGINLKIFIIEKSILFLKNIL
jgi:hypothetical protein